MFTGRKESTAHGTQAAGYFEVETADIKAMIDFSALFLYVFTSLFAVLLGVCFKVQWLGPLQLLIFSEAKKMNNVYVCGPCLQG